MSALDVALPEIELLLGEDDDAAAFGRLIGQRRELGGVRQFLGRHLRRREEGRCLPVTQGDGSGLIQQQNIDVAGGLDGTAGGRDHVRLHHAAHTRDADGRQEPADRGRNQTYQQGHERRNGDGCSELCGLHTVEGEGEEGHDDDQEYQGERHQQDGQRDLVRCLLAFRSLDHGDHAIEEGVAGIDGDPHDDPIRQDPCAAGDRGKIASRFTDDGGRLSRDGALVDRRHPFGHFAVHGNDFSRLDEYQIALAQISARHLGGGTRRKGRIGQLVRHDELAHIAERGGLRAAPAFGQRLGKVGEQHREGEPYRDRRK